MSQVLQVLGALLLLSGFIAAQAGVVKDSSASYLTANAVGGTVLAALAYAGRDYGFLLLEGTWAVVSAISLYRAFPAGKAAAADPTAAFSTAKAADKGLPLPMSRSVQLNGDELSTEQRLVRYFRNSYAGSQGRQWLQPHILWWSLAFLRDNGIRIDFDTLVAAGERARTMPLPAGHTKVHPADQAELNFAFWWSILIDIARVVYRPQRRFLPGVAVELPTVADLQRRAWDLGLRPWMSSATTEELAGIAHALAIIDDHERKRPADPDLIMSKVLLPELLLVELHWLHTPGGRVRADGLPRVDVVLLRRYSRAQLWWADDRYLDPLDHMYLRAGDILNHLARLPKESQTPTIQSMLSMYEEVLIADTKGTVDLPSSPAPVDTVPNPSTQVDTIAGPPAQVDTIASRPAQVDTIASRPAQVDTIASRPAGTDTRVVAPATASVP
ncbi:hypothetical protein [Nocardia altamirensis]|uniref:hypothetical protein n=1 Tax=Nocardia altamirensis TaxID=472158 RepID=UPI00157CF542|nr:hypothetical protein [Nocardia altamirensis]